MRKIVYPYKMGSSSAKLLAKELGAIRVYPDRRYRPKPDDLVINWGSTTIPNWFGGAKILNKLDRVSLAVNKLDCLLYLKERGISVPDFTFDRNIATSWLDEDNTVVVRRMLRASQGRGIILHNDPFRPLEPAPLYTGYIENHGEYRVHVFNGEVIDYAKKLRKTGDSQTEEQNLIRTNENGWIYVRGHLKRVPRIMDLALRAMSCLGLDFGAVDIIKDETGRIFVLEVNTSPGLCPRTLSSYVNAINNYATNR